MFLFFHPQMDGELLCVSLEASMSNRLAQNKNEKHSNGKFL